MAAAQSCNDKSIQVQQQPIQLWRLYLSLAGSVPTPCTPRCRAITMQGSNSCCSPAYIIQCHLCAVLPTLLRLAEAPLPTTPSLVSLCSRGA